MKILVMFLLLSMGCLTFGAPKAGSKIDRQPGVVILSDVLVKPVKLEVISDATVYGDKEGKSKLGTLVKGQSIILESMTERAYKVRGKGTRYGVAGWVSPKAFSSSDPDFVENLKKIHTRSLSVQKLIAAGEIAIGMTMKEVTLSIGEPSKRSNRRTQDGQTSKWEYVTADIQNYYQTVQNPYTGNLYRRYSHSTQIETSRVDVEFSGEVVVAIAESEDDGKNSLKVVVPPIAFLY